VGIFNIFGKESVESIISKAELSILKTYGIVEPSPAQKFMCSLSLGIAAMGILSTVGKGRLNSLMDEVSDVAYNSTKFLSFRINEITADEGDLEEIFSMMPPDMDGDTSIKINGGVAFPALFNSKGPELMREIKDKSTGPMGPTGYASIVVGDLMLGREKSKPYFMQVSLILNEMTQKLLKNA
jgi:hypothetical protein